MIEHFAGKCISFQTALALEAAGFKGTAAKGWHYFCKKVEEKDLRVIEVDGVTYREVPKSKWVWDKNEKTVSLTKSNITLSDYMYDPHSDALALAYTALELLQFFPKDYAVTLQADSEALAKQLIEGKQRQTETNET